MMFAHTYCVKRLRPARRFDWIPLWSLLLAHITGSPVWATNGMEMTGFGARAAGMGGATTALEEGPANLIKNPASISFLTTRQCDAGLSILSPILHFRNALNDTAANRDTHEAMYGFFPMPLLAYGQPFGREPRLSWGIGLFVPGGLGADYTLDHELWPTGVSYHSQLIYAKVIAAIAYRIADRVSAGAGLNFGFGWMDLWQPFATRSDFAQGATSGTPAGIIAPTYGEVFTRMGYEEVTCRFTMRQATSLGVGLTLGVRYAPTTWLSFGIGYTTPMRLHWKASSTMDMTEQFRAASNRFGLPVDLASVAFGLSPGLGMVDHPDVAFRLDWPQKVTVGLSLRPAQNVVCAVDVSWINWAATMDRFVMNFSSLSNPNFIKMIGGTTCTRTVPLDWRDQYVVAVGGAYTFGNGFTLRAGYNYGRNPVPAEAALPTFPALVEHHLAVGVGKRWEKLEVNVAFEHAWKKGLETDQSLVARAFDGSRNELSEYVFSLGVTWRGTGR